MRQNFDIEACKEKCNQLSLEFISTHKKPHDGTMIDYICNRHKDKGIQSVSWSHFKSYKKVCPYCTGRYKTNEDIIPLIKNKDVELVSEYVGNEKDITCKCKKCGNVWITLPKVLTTNGSGCPVCGFIKSKESITKSQDTFGKELHEVNPDIEIVGKYINTHTKVKCKCKVCGTEWNGYPANLLNRSASCPTCNLSASERMMLQVLDKIGINYKTQYIIDDCIYVSKLKFDAFDIENNIAFEYNGEQHYMPIDFAGKGEEWAKQIFSLTQKRDNAKINYCNKNNIPIIIIPYWEKSNMEFFITKKLKEIKRINDKCDLRPH